MANVIIKEFYNVKNNDVIEIIPIGDTHLGSIACLEKELAKIIDHIATHENSYWIGMGDYCEFINMSDPRFDPGSLATWIKLSDLKNLSMVQKEKFLSMIKPIAHKCLAMVKGNHEGVIQKFYEHDIYSAIVTEVKKMGGMSEDTKLAIGMYGWLSLKIYLGNTKISGCRNVKINLHHGFTGGRLSGAKALNMQRWLWSHDADVVIWGHTHNKMLQPEAVEILAKNDKIIIQERIGIISGTYLAGVVEGASTYSEEKGYLPLPAGKTPKLYIKITTHKPRPNITAEV